jgi:hypothetical protein
MFNHSMGVKATIFSRSTAGKTMCIPTMLHIKSYHAYTTCRLEFCAAAFIIATPNSMRRAAMCTYS